MRSFNVILAQILGAAALCSCSSQYNIDGNSSIAGIDGQKMYLRMMTSDGRSEMICLDSCEVVHGTFNFGGVIDSVAIADLYMGSSPMMPIVLENGSLFIQMDNMMQSVSGGPLNERLSQFMGRRNRCETELWDLNRRARMMVYEGKSVDQIVLALDPIRNKLVDQLKELDMQFIKDNYSNVLGPGYFMRICTDDYGTPRKDDEILKILADAPRAFLEHPNIENFLFMAGITPESLQSLRTTQAKDSLTEKKKVKAKK